MTDGRTYTLAPRDETGWVFGLSLAQIAVLGISAATSVLLLRVVAPPFAVLAVMVGAFLALGRLNGMPVLDMIPVGVTWLVDWRNRRESWFRSIPVITEQQKRSDACKSLADQEVLLLDAAAFGAGPAGTVIVVSHDVRSDSYGVSMQVMGREFSLLDGEEQDRMAAGWAGALQGFIADRSTIATVRWSEWAAPAGLSEHRQWLREQLADEPLDLALLSYQQLLQESGALSTRHETLVTLTIDGRTAKVKSNRSNRARAVVDALLTEAKLFARRMEGVGLTVGGPLTVTEWARAMRLRIDPSSRTVLDARARSLGSIAGAISPVNAGPSAAAAYWTEWVVDESMHRSFFVSQWPRTGVSADWMAPLMLYNGCVRTVSVFYEPIPRYISQRSIRRSSTKIDADTESRLEKGMRIGASYDLSKEMVEARDSELVAGYGELSYAGVVTVTADNIEELDEVSDEIKQVAASIGIELRPLHGRHADAFCATLPLARSVARGRML